MSRSKSDTTAKILPTFANRLKEFRDAKHWTQSQLAEHAGISQPSVHALESGASRPSWDTVVALAEALGVTTEEFL